jgi:uncharacterized Zn-finger protein
MIFLNFIHFQSEPHQFSFLLFFFLIDCNMKGIKEYKVTLFHCMMGDCNKSYSTKFNLKRHVEVFHLKQRKHHCEVCNQCFVSQQNLREHSFIHQDIKPYKCPHCDMSFRQISQFAIHKRNHEFYQIEKDHCLEMIELGILSSERRKVQ